MGQEITQQSTGMYTTNLHKSIDMLNKNTPGVKKAKPSRKHQLALIRTLKVWYLVEAKAQIFC